MKQSKNLKAVFATLMLVVVAVIWGSGFIGVQMSIDSNFSPSLIMTSRFTVATVILLFIFYKDIKLIKMEEFKKGSIAGVLLFLGFFLQTVGLKFTTPSNNAFITAINVVMVPFITWMILRKKPDNKTFVAAVTCLVGIGFLTFSIDKGFSFNYGDLLTLFCALLFAGHISYLSFVSDKVEFKKLTFIQLAVGSVLSIVTLVLFDIKSLEVAQWKSGLLPVIYLGVFSTCIAFFIQTYAQRYVSATKAAIILSMEALFGCLFSVLLGYEALTNNMLIGGMLILFSIIMLEAKFSLKSTAKKVELDS